MPLILLSGFPSSGKTHRAKQLVDYFQGRIDANASQPTPDPRIARLRVHRIDDTSLGLSREAYREARTEKDARSTLYSAIRRALGRDDIVIADAMNFIKGYRYQLFCEAKALQTPSCVVHIGTPIDTCRSNNRLLLGDDTVDGGYPDDIFEDLVRRYEEPNGMTRWDSPLFTVIYDDPSPPCDAIWDALVGAEGKAKLVKPHQATVLKPASESNYLYELDRTTQEVLTHIQTWQKDHPGEEGGQISIPEAELPIELPASPLSLSHLQRMRRQFITLNRQHTLPKSRIRDLFIDYLNTNFA
ncbi:chromatin associated protein KTI12 [Xylona heveae TC161]|uniref:Chromatin associated protein KTI12 n=1 Tax=Xylona heveae (strain CBS 132557 / TC161) TaxID=1328760 RepID=A0A165HK23_XYLHT|nr:chromatin associated protein KTI12 [Xylona heveae TC161]KZF23631.1 chromatin associated protein KTI12 [Xylona heveae TC161]